MRRSARREFLPSLDLVDLPSLWVFNFDELDRLTAAFTDTWHSDGQTNNGIANYDETYTYDAGGSFTGSAERLGDN